MKPPGMCWHRSAAPPPVILHDVLWCCGTCCGVVGLHLQLQQLHRWLALLLLLLLPPSCPAPAPSR